MIEEAAQTDVSVRKQSQHAYELGLHKSHRLRGARHAPLHLHSHLHLLEFVNVLAPAGSPTFLGC